ncbi:hypothetical protein GGU11DRAFT_760952, partial [Lentinula aff. detonsa]
MRKVWFAVVVGSDDGDTGNMEVTIKEVVDGGDDGGLNNEKGVFAIVVGSDDGDTGDMEVTIKEGKIILTSKSNTIFQTNNGPFCKQTISKYWAVGCMGTCATAVEYNEETQYYSTISYVLRTSKLSEIFISDEAQDNQEEGIDEDNTWVERTSEEDALYQEQRKMEYQAKLDGEKGRSDSNDTWRILFVTSLSSTWALPSPRTFSCSPVTKSLSFICSLASSVPSSINPSTGKPVWIKTPMDTSWAFSQAHTRKSLWVGNQIVVVKHPSRKGYRGTVGDVRQNDTYSSGLGTLIHYDVIGVGSEWLDFDDVRNAHNQFCLNQLSALSASFTTIETQGWMFTIGLKLAIPPLTAKLNVVNDDNKRYEDELRALMSVEIPKPHEWILDPQFKVALGDLELSIMVHSGKFCSNKDQLVHIG